MKKNILLVALALLATYKLSAQTALYKKFVDLPSITATCIENYPIGNKTTATITMLVAQDSMTYRYLMKTLVSLPYKNDKTGERYQYYKPFNDKFHIIKEIQRASKDTLQKEKPSIQMFLESVKRMEINVSKKEDNPNKKPTTVQFTSLRADALPGDNGTYLISGSPQEMTVLVFLCPDEKTIQQASSFILDYMSYEMNK